MNLSFFPDVNVWLALNHTIHVHHLLAMDWYLQLPKESFFVFCRPTQTGLFRLLTTAAVMCEDTLSQKQCRTLYDTWIQGGKAVLWPEPVDLEALFRKMPCGQILLQKHGLMPI